MNTGRSNGYCNSSTNHHHSHTLPRPTNPRARRELHPPLPHREQRPILRAARQTTTPTLASAPPSPRRSNPTPPPRPARPLPDHPNRRLHPPTRRTPGQDVDAQSQFRSGPLARPGIHIPLRRTQLLRPPPRDEPPRPPRRAAAAPTAAAHDPAAREL